MKKWIYRLLMLICVCVLGYSAYNLWLIYNDKQKSDEGNGKKVVEEMKDEVDNGFKPDWDSLRAQFPDIVAWIYVPDCDCSFPVVQSTDNSFYLDRAADQSESRYGAIFLEAGQDSTFKNDNSIIYGHSSDDDEMMTKLYNFTDETFFNEHPYFYLFTPEQNYRCSIITFARTEDGSDYYETNLSENRDEIISYWYSHATFSRQADTDDKDFVTISTCNVKEYGFYSLQRLVITGSLEAYDEPIEIKD